MHGGHDDDDDDDHLGVVHGGRLLKLHTQLAASQTQLSVALLNLANQPLRNCDIMSQKHGGYDFI